jgi:cellulose synthase/poly-beta-1,6-N-acetylglucosamine synthase-like glycosyltransferase
LPRAVSSAQAAGTNIEVVVVDDASSDETAAVCKNLSGIKYVRVETNQGVAGARNIGLVASRGEYLSFLDDDDTRLPDSMDAQIDSLRREPQAGLIYGRAIYGTQEGLPGKQSYPNECPAGDIFWKLLGRNFIPCGSAVFRRSCLTRVGLLDDAISGLDDWDLWVRIAEVYPILSAEAPVIVWRRSAPNSGQGTSRAAQLVTKSIGQFRNDWMRLPRALSAPGKQRRSAWREFSENMIEHLIWESGRAVRCGEWSQAVWNLLVLPRFSPLTLMRIVRHRVFRVRRAGSSGPLSTFSNQV